MIPHDVKACEVAVTPVKKVEKQGITEYGEIQDEFDTSDDEEEYFPADDYYLRSENSNVQNHPNSRTRMPALSQ